MNAISVTNLTPRFVNKRRNASPFSSTSEGGVDYGRAGPFVARIPCLSEKFSDASTILDDLGSQLLEDMESILEGVTIASATKTALDECHNFAKPCLHAHRNSNLTELMIKGRRNLLSKTKARQRDRQTFLTRTTGYHIPTKRIDLYLEEELARMENEDTLNTTESRELVSKSCPSYGAISKREKFGKNNNFIASTIPVVWAVQPTVRNGKTKFKLSTESGACFYLKEKGLVDFLKMTKRLPKNDSVSSASCSVYLQVYTMNSRRSRVVKSDGISSLIEEITMSTAGRWTRDYEDHSCTKVYDTRNDLSEVDASTSSATIPFGNNKNRSHGLVKRFTRYLNRQRFKHLIYQQANNSLSNINGRS